MPKLGKLVDSGFAEGKYERGLATKLLVEKLGRVKATKLRRESLKEIEELTKGAYTFSQSDVH